MGKLAERFKHWQSISFLVRLLVVRDLRAHYKRTLLGASWSIVRPLATLAIFVFVFEKLMKVSTEDTPYPVFALAGLLAWQAFADALTKAGNSVINNANIIQKSNVERIVFPLSASVHGLIYALASYVVFAGILIFYQSPWHLPMLWVPVLLLLQTAAAAGAGLALAGLVVFVRDIPLLLPLLLQLLMLASPIAYPIDLVPEQWRSLYMLNPVAILVEAHRDVIVRGATPELSAWMSLVGITAACVFIGLFVFRRLNRRIPDIL